MAVVAESQFHVLAVDDSLMDRKLIERLLKTSSFQGTKPLVMPVDSCFELVSFPSLLDKLVVVVVPAVTAVDSGSRALQVLGLSEDLTSSPAVSPAHNGSSSLRDIPVVIMSSENVPSRINR
ncbi:hypothetical protein B296_00031076 [Ensete ventricosum]|uniref:Response regulatory domain-containing protein n=1 Tax=Ensete ventricosum TaxID=4639 RepID=A0A426ZKF1_ENSVE|nr:hypothetical protein B296_00031076 [Ensete ventricosum]